MQIFIAILPSILWGIGPILYTLIGGKPIQQLVGSTYGQLITGLIIYLCYMPSINGSQFFWPFIGGLAWSIAQLMQLISFKQLNVSLAMPISTGLLLIEIPLIGVMFDGDWSTSLEKILGFGALFVLLIGIIMTNFQDKKSDQLNHRHLDYKGGLTRLIVGSFGYTACSVFPKITNAPGTVGVLPQSLGMCLGGVLLAFYFQHKQQINMLTAQVTMKNIFVGMLGGLGTLFYLISLQVLGPATSFPLTQMNVVVSTLGGIFILKEHKDHKELSFIVAGLILIVAANTLIAHL